MIENLLGHWHGFGPETKAALISGGTTLIAAFVGAAVIFFQIGRQGKLNRDSVAENEKRRLKSKMYDEVEAGCIAVSDAQAEYLSKLILATQEIQIAANSHKEAREYPTPRARVMELSRLDSQFQTALIGLVLLIERRQFIAPKILVFRTAISAAAHGARETFAKKFFTPAMHMLPTDRPDGNGTFPYTPPSPQDADALHALAMTIIGHLHDVVGYVEDFSVEMQNLLVADLFTTKVAHRKPIDPAVRVIRLDDAAELERYFVEETEWGRWVAEEEASAVKRLEGSTKTD